MKKSSMLIMFFLSTLFYAQEKPFQFSIGLNRSWFIYDEDFMDELSSDFRPKLSVELQYNYATWGNFTANAGIRYYNLGRFVDLSSNGFEGGGTSRIDHYLVSVPLQLKYRIGIINTNAILNAETSYVLSSETESPDFLTPNNIVKRDVTEEMNRFQFTLGIGLEYILDISGETFGIRSIYNYGLTNIPKKGEFTSPAGIRYTWVNYKTSEIDLSLSYYF